jgi:hypothetical protein
MMNAKLREVLTELVASIDKRWEHETQRKREAAISPRTEEALDAARALLATPSPSEPRTVPIQRT